MKPGSEGFLRKARTYLIKAQELIDAGRWPDEAGRAAYLGAFHAAQALLLETEGRLFKTHSGVHGAFGSLVRDDPRFSGEQRKFLSRAYELKTTADYEIDPTHEITLEQAINALAAARGFVATVAGILEAAS